MPICILRRIFRPYISKSGLAFTILPWRLFMNINCRCPISFRISCLSQSKIIVGCDNGEIRRPCHYLYIATPRAVAYLSRDIIYTKSHIGMKFHRAYEYNGRWHQRMASQLTRGRCSLSTAITWFELLKCHITSKKLLNKKYFHML